jgi:hypothetical protein
MIPASHRASRMVLAVATAAVLALGVTPSAAAAVDADGATAPDRATIDQTIERLTSRARQERADRAAWAALGDAFMQKARETADASYYGRAEQAFERARALDPAGADALVGLAWVQSARHEFERSIESARQALAVDAANAAAYGLLGDAALELGDYDLATELECARLLTYEVAERLEQGADPVTTRMTSMAKIKTSEVAKRIALEGMQMMGGYGYATEYDMESHVRHSLVLPIYAGTNEIQREIISGSLGLR